jgi:hypothetical protein
MPHSETFPSARQSIPTSEAGEASQAEAIYRQASAPGYSRNELTPLHPLPAFHKRDKKPLMAQPGFDPAHRSGIIAMFQGILRHFRLAGYCARSGRMQPRTGGPQPRRLRPATFRRPAGA